MFHLLSLILLAVVLGQTAAAGEFKLVDGKVVTGEPASFNEQGAIFRLPDGKFSERYQWFKFAPETLKEFLGDPKAKRFVEPLVGPPPEAPAPPKKQETYQIKQPPKVELPPPGTGIVSAAVTPIGLALLAVLMLANLFAAFEVAVFKNYPPLLVCGLAVALPVIAPISFLCLKSRPVVFEAAPDDTPTVEETIHAEPPASLPKPGIPDEDEEAGPGLSIAARQEEPSSVPLDYRQEYKRGDHIFNRRFFESTFPGFFRVVPADHEKDLVMVIISSRGEYIGRRISRISVSDMHIQVQAGGASSEAAIPFNEIRSVIVRHKDATD